MFLKILASLIGAALLVAYIAPVAIKLTDAAFSIVVLIGLAMMITDLWQTLREPG